MGAQITRWYINKDYAEEYLAKLSGVYDRLCTWTVPNCVPAHELVLHIKLAEVETQHLQEMILLNLQQKVVSSLCVYYDLQPDEDIARYVSASPAHIIDDRNLGN